MKVRLPDLRSIPLGVEGRDGRGDVITYSFDDDVTAPITSGQSPYSYAALVSIDDTGVLGWFDDFAQWARRLSGVSRPIAKVLGLKQTES